MRFIHIRRNPWLILLSTEARTTGGLELQSRCTMYTSIQHACEGEGASLLVCPPCLAHSYVSMSSRERVNGRTLPAGINSVDRPTVGARLSL